MLEPGVRATGVAVGLLFVFASEEKRFPLGASADVLPFCSTGLRLLNGLLDSVVAVAGAWGVDTGLNRDGVAVVAVAVGRLAKGLPAGAEVGVNALGAAEVEVNALGVAELEAPKRLDEGASAFCGVALKLNKLDAGAVAVVLLVPCAVVPKPPKVLFFDGCADSSLFCAPKPLNRLLGAGVSADAFAPNPANRLLDAGVLAAGVADEVAPKVKDWGAGAGVLEAFGAGLEFPNMPLEAAPLVAPNVLLCGALLVVPNMLPCAPLVVPNILLGGAPLVAPNMLLGGAPLVAPNMLVDGAALVLFCPRPPKGLPCGWVLKSDEPPNGGGAAAPLVEGAGVDAAKGLLPVAVFPVEVKLKPADCGGALKAAL